MTKEYLNPKSSLLNETVSWLCGNGVFEGRVRIVDGAHSLSHILVVVPTAQSGRNLRFALAEEARLRGWGGILPPKVAMANSLLAANDVRAANEAEELSIMAGVLLDCDIGKYKALFPRPPTERTYEWALDMAGVILGIESVLAEAALLMEEVKPAQDLERWRDLAELENMFFKRLEANGVVGRSLARRAAVAAGCREQGIGEIVLPASLDIQCAFAKYLENSSQKVTLLIHADESDAEKFDEWGRPTAVFAADLGVGMVESFPTAVVEADEIAKCFRSVRDEDALPALVVCDAEMHPELEGAFQNYFSEDELVLRNPSRERLARSSLGRLLGAIVQLEAERDYDTFSTLVRTGDVARWACGALSETAVEMAKFIGALDAVQNAHLPRTIDETIAAAAHEAEGAWSAQERHAAAGLKRLAEAVKCEIGDPIAFVRKIFASVTLDEKRPADRELVAAAQTVRELREACSSNLVPEVFRRRLFARLLKAATYMLEPTAENVLSTTGWLEVPWCNEQEMVIAGFNEGCVPENIVGHPFLPDALRKDLKIATNAGREARDSFIFAQAVACRAKGAVSVYMHQISGDKNVMKPSRILFNGIGDGDLPELARRLYSVAKGGEGAPAKELPPAWRLKLPIPPRGTVFRERMSPTALDQYARCPFNFYLQEVVGIHSDDRNQELDAMAFGTLCHGVLERFAVEGPKDSTDADVIAAYLAGEVRRRLEAFGKVPPAVIALQGEAAIERLKAFAQLQAARRREGWRIVYSEQKFECRIKSCPTLLRGKVDRIDVHEKTGEIAIIDYKTWSRAKDEYYKSSVQLPVYRAMLEASGLFDAARARTSKAFYCVLAERAEDVKFDVENACGEGGQSEAEDLIVGYLTSIAKGIFYPPKAISGKAVWRQDYAQLIWRSPEEGIDCAWIEDQKSRMENA